MTGLARPSLLNAIPKSGTHVAMRCVSLMPGVSGPICGSGEQPFLSAKDSVAAALQTLRGLRHGQFAVGHLRYEKRVANVIEERSIRSVLVVRDPRDVAVSLMCFLRDVADFPQHDFICSLPDDRLRILAVLHGFDFQLSAKRYQLTGIAETYAAFLPWRSAEGWLVVRFEDLVGPDSGGTASRQQKTIRRIGIHLGVTIDDAQVKHIAGVINTRREITFRKGVIGAWKESFDRKIIREFKEAAGRTLAVWGYEGTSDWEL